MIAKNKDCRDYLLNIWDIVKNNYVLFNERGVNWEEVKEKYKNKLLYSTYSDEFDLIEEMLLELKDPHTKLIRSNKANIYISQVSVFNIEDDFYIISNRKNDSGLKVGMKILSVNKINIDDFVSQVKLKYNYCSQNMVTAETIKLLTYSASKKSIMLTAANEIEEVTEKVEFEMLSNIVNMRKQVDCKKDINIIIENKLDNVGYIKVLSFMTSNITEKFLRKLNNLYDCKSLIIDVRSNMGGFIDETKKFTSLFIKEQVELGYEVRNNSNCDFNKIILLPDEKCIVDRFEKIIFLCDGYTASSSEFLLLKAIKNSSTNITIIGNKTAGLPHSATVYELINGYKLSITTIKYLDINKNVIDEDGIQPDIIVNNDKTIFVTGEDKQLLYAINYCNKCI